MYVAVNLHLHILLEKLIFYNLESIRVRSIAAVTNLDSRLKTE